MHTQAPRSGLNHQFIGDHTYEYPLLPGEQSIQAAESGHNSCNYHLYDCPAYGIASDDMTVQYEPAEGAIYEEESRSIVHCATSSSSPHSPKEQDHDGKNGEDTIQLEAMASYDQQESSDGIHFPLCPAYSSKPDRRSSNMQESSKDTDAIQCSPCQAYSSKPESEGGDTTQHEAPSLDLQESSRDIESDPCPAYSPKPGGEPEIDTNGLQDSSKDSNTIKCAPCPAYSFDSACEWDGESKIAYQWSKFTWDSRN